MSYEELWHRLTPLYDAGEAKAIVRWLLDVCFGLSPTDVYCGKVTQLSADDQTELGKMMLRLEKGEPVQYVAGVADFCGRQFRVAPGVLIPRPETAELCQWIIESPQMRILDVGTGSGCIAVTLAAEIPQSRVTAWDISDDALRIASENAECARVHVSFERQDVLSLPSGSSGQAYDIIVSNPPYIQPSESDGMAKNVLDYEPSIALFAPADDPIIFYRRIGDYAIRSLTRGGQLFFELNPLTASAVVDYLRSIGFADTEIRQDQFGKNRFLKATKI